MASDYEERSAVKDERSRRIQTLEARLLNTKEAALRALQVCRAQRAAILRAEEALQDVINAVALP